MTPDERIARRITIALAIAAAFAFLAAWGLFDIIGRLI